MATSCYAANVREKAEMLLHNETKKMDVVNVVLLWRLLMLVTTYFQLNMEM